MSISQAPILCAAKPLDFGKQYGKGEKFPIKIVKFKKIESKKNVKLDIRNQISLKNINKYQFRRDLNKQNIPVKKIGESKIKNEKG